MRKDTVFSFLLLSCMALVIVPGRAEAQGMSPFWDARTLVWIAQDIDIFSDVMEYAENSVIKERNAVFERNERALERLRRGLKPRQTVSQVYPQEFARIVAARKHIRSVERLTQRYKSIAGGLGRAAGILGYVNDVSPSIVNHLRQKTYQSCTVAESKFFDHTAVAAGGYLGAKGGKSVGKVAGYALCDRRGGHICKYATRTAFFVLGMNMGMSTGKQTAPRIASKFDVCKDLRAMQALPQGAQGQSMQGAQGAQAAPEMHTTIPSWQPMDTRDVTPPWEVIENAPPLPQFELPSPAKERPPSVTPKPWDGSARKPEEVEASPPPSPPQPPKPAGNINDYLEGR